MKKKATKKTKGDKYEGKAKNDDKKTKNNKSRRMAGVEKGDAPNTGTAYINGTFNVNVARNELKKYIKENLKSELGSNNAQYAYAAIAEAFALYIVRASGRFNAMSAIKADLYEVDFENIRRAIRESKEFNADIKALSDAFNPIAMNYTTSFFVTEKVMRKFFFGGKGIRQYYKCSHQ